MADTAAWIARVTKERFAAGFTASTTDPDQLSVGIGGEIPVFPPFLVVTLPLIGLLFKVRCGKKRNDELRSAIYKTSKTTRVGGARGETTRAGRDD